MSDELGSSVRKHGPDLYRIAWRILRHADDVDEVLQDVFLEALQFSQRERVFSWIGLLKRLTVCRSLDRLRRRRTNVSMDGFALPSLDRSPCDLASDRELQMRLRQTLGQLPPRQAEVFCLRYFDDLSNQQIADTLCISASAVATALRKARVKLTELLPDELSKGARP